MRTAVLSGLLELSLSIGVQAFHVPKIIFFLFTPFYCCRVEQVMFEMPFLVSSLMWRWPVLTSKRAPQSHGILPNSSVVPGKSWAIGVPGYLCTGLEPWLSLRTEIQRWSVTTCKETACRDRNDTSNSKNELQSFLCIISYLVKFSTSATEVCEPLIRLTSSKCEWTENSTYKSLHKRAKTISKMNTTMAFYNENGQICTETDASSLGQGSSLLQVRIACGFEGTKHQICSVVAPSIQKEEPDM